MHPAVAFVTSIFLIWLLVSTAQRSTHPTGQGAASAAGHWDNRRLSALVLLLLVFVYALGVLDVALLAPLWVQVAHLLAADSLWVSLVVLTARLTLVSREGC
jgi:cytochrome c oxidase assembly protein subunit 15